MFATEIHPETFRIRGTLVCVQVAHGAKIDAVDNEGKTALEYFPAAHAATRDA